MDVKPSMPMSLGVLLLFSFRFFVVHASGVFFHANFV